MNYEEMSDFKIKHAVAKIVLWDRRDCEEVYCNPVTGECRWADGANWHNFDPLNNPSDAWPIIVKNKIRISPVMHMSDDNGEYLCNGMWEAGALWSDDGAFYNSKYNEASNENPLRAAMIVFLMMQDGSK